MKSNITVLSLILLLLVSPAFAATTGTLSLLGTVAPLTAITVTPDPNASNLPVDLVASNLKVATVNELSNDKAGYTVTLSTANGSVLKETAGSDTLAYSLTYNGAAVVFASNTAIISDVASRTSVAGSSKDLAISFAATFLNADTYSDTLTFTIIAK
jgi:hypothetical protein